MSTDDIELRIASPPDKGQVITNHSDGNQCYYSDDETLRRLGKRPLLIRSFGFMSSLGLSCSALCSWEGALVSSVPSLITGGPGAVVWSFLIAWVGITSVYAVIAELASVAPTAGGQCMLNLPRVSVSSIFRLEQLQCANHVFSP